MFRRMDDDGSRGLNLEEFVKGIRETGLELNEDEVSHTTLTLKATTFYIIEKHTFII